MAHTNSKMMRQRQTTGTNRWTKEVITCSRMAFVTATTAILKYYHSKAAVSTMHNSVNTGSSVLSSMHASFCYCN